MVRHASFDVGDVAFLDHGRSAQESLPLGLLLRVQVLLALLPTHDLAVSRDLEALRCGLSGLKLVLPLGRSDLLGGGRGAACARTL